MNEDLLQELFDLLPEGSFENPSELTPIIESEGVEVFFEDMPLNAFFDMEEYKEVFGELKKKREFEITCSWKKGFGIGWRRGYYRYFIGFKTTPVKY